MPESLPRGQKSGTEESCHSREGGAHPGLSTWDAYLTLPSELGILTQGHEVVSAGTGRQECCPAGGWRAGLRTPPPMAGHSLTVQQEPCSGAHAWGQLRLVSHIPAERLAKAPVGGHSPCPPHPRISPRLSRRSCWKTGHAILDVWHVLNSIQYPFQGSSARRGSPQSRGPRRQGLLLPTWRAPPGGAGCSEGNQCSPRAQLPGWQAKVGLVGKEPAASPSTQNSLTTRLSGPGQGRCSGSHGRGGKKVAGLAPSGVGKTHYPTDVPFRSRNRQKLPWGEHRLGHSAPNTSPPNSTVQQGSAFPLSKPLFPPRGLQLRADGETQWGVSSMSACAREPRSGNFPRQTTPPFHFPSQAVISPGPWATGPSQDPSGLMHTHSLGTA